MIFVFYQFILKCLVHFSLAMPVTTFGITIVVIFPPDPLPEICPIFQQNFNNNKELLIKNSTFECT